MRARRSFMVVALGAGMALLGGCGSSPGGGQNDAGTHCSISGVTLNGSTATVAPNTAVNLTAAVNQSAGSSGCSGSVAWAVNPSTGGLNSSGLTATFANATPGIYTVTITSNDDSQKSASWKVTVQNATVACGTPNGTVVTHSGNITADETWAGNGVTHSVPAGGVRIKAPATVTIQPCAIVSIAKDTEIGVVGDLNGNQTAKLVAAGTDDQSGVVFFIPAVSGQPWGFIHGYNALSLVELDHTQLIQAGGAATFFANSAIGMVGPGLDATPLPVLKVDHVVIDHPVGGGIFLDAMAAFTSDSTLVGVIAPQDHPISLFLMAAGSIPQVSLEQVPAQTTPFTNAHILASRPDVRVDTTINGNIPLYLEASVNVVDNGANPNPAGVTLTVQAGAELRFKPGAALRMVFGGRGNPPNDPVGRLIALGTPTAPIRFTSAAAVPAPGDWAGIQLATSDLSQMAFNIIEYAGGFGGVVSANCRPTGSSDNAALIIGGPDYTPPGSMIVSSIIQYSAGHAIDATWENSTYNDPNLADSANLNVFNSNAGCKQTYNGLIPGAGSCPQGGGCTEQ